MSNTIEACFNAFHATGPGVAAPVEGVAKVAGSNQICAA